MAHPYLALRPTRNGRGSHYAVAGSKNPLPLGMGSVKSWSEVEKWFTDEKELLDARGAEMYGEHFVVEWIS